MYNTSAMMQREKKRKEKYLKEEVGNLSFAWMDFQAIQFTSYSEWIPSHRSLAGSNHSLQFRKGWLDDPLLPFIALSLSLLKTIVTRRGAGDYGRRRRTKRATNKHQIWVGGSGRRKRTVNNLNQKESLRWRAHSSGIIKQLTHLTNHL